MKKYLPHPILVLWAMVLAIILIGCPSTPTVDPDNGVSNASYRKTLVVVRDSVASVTSRMLVAKDEDQQTTMPVHSVEWWDAQIRELRITGGLANAALTGETK